MLAMHAQPHRAKLILRGDLARPWRIDDLARLCAAPRRTLEKHFRRFGGCAPLEFLRSERLGQARRKLLRAPPGASVMGIAADCGLNHFRHFAVVYRERHGESPSAPMSPCPGLRQVRTVPPDGIVGTPATGAASIRRDRPASGAEDMADAIGAALHRTGWVRIVPAPAGRSARWLSSRRQPGCTGSWLRHRCWAATAMAGLPHTRRFLDRVAEGLADLGMPHG